MAESTQSDNMWDIQWEGVLADAKVIAWAAHSFMVAPH